jgi:4,5-dihydroxyphthalate decarboxylase
VTALSAAIGRYPHTEAILAGMPGFALADVAPISRAFAPMVREARYDISEMAIATFLMAKAWGKPLALLPVVLAARFQESALLCRADGPVKRPEDLAGRRVGVRAYSQTTGMWLRGVLAERHGVRPADVRWITFEDAHVAEYADPPFVTRGKGDPLALLKAGDLDAAIFGNDTPSDPALRTVFADPAAAGEGFRAAHGFVPVNHLLVARADIARERPAAIATLIGALRAGGTSVPGMAALAPALTLAARWCADQGLTPRALTLDEIWHGTPAGLGGLP